MSKKPTDLQICPLHTHTTYSVLDGAANIDQYMDWCKQNGAPAMGITDHGWMIGALEVHKKGKKKGVTGIPGCEFYLAPPKDYQFTGKPFDYFHVTVWAINEKGYRNLLKLGSMSWNSDELPGWQKVRGEERWESVMKPRVVKKFQSEKPRITFEELLNNHEGLILGSGCLIGVLNKAFMQGEFGQAERNLMRLMEVFKGRIFMEVMPHICDHDWNYQQQRYVMNECTEFSPDGDKQKACNLASIQVARKFDIPLLLTIDSHFVQPKQKALQDILLSNGKEGGWGFYNSYHMMTTDDAWQHWSERYGDDVEQQKLFVEGVESNHIIAELAKGLEIKDPYRQPVPELPREVLELNLPSEGSKLKAALLHWVNYHGRMRWDNETWVKRLETELEVICDNGIIDFSKYFLFLEKQYRWTRENSILAAPGRGSGAGSLLCYLLKVTHLNPFLYNLPFERFLSHARLKRGKFPDIDCDFGDREPLLAHLEETYGDRFAQCSTHGTLKVKSSIKDACRTILRDYTTNPAVRETVEDITRSIPNTPQGVADRDFLLGWKDGDGNFNQGHLDENPKLKAFFDQYPDIYDAVLQLLGVPKSVGRHASAYFVSDAPIWESVPLCKVGDMVVTQYTAQASNNMVEAAGLIKFDFLRVNTLSDISGCIRLVQRRMGFKTWQEKRTINGKEFEITFGELPITALPIAPKADCDVDPSLILDIYELPEVEEVFKDFDDGKTESIFQMQTPLMTGFAKRIKPRCIFHCSDIVALVRPGPLEALIEDGKTTMTEAYIRRKDGEMPITYAHPGMEPILKDTYGVAVYQEQLQQMFVDLAGYSMEEADYLRETLAKKKRQDMEKAIPELRRRLQERGWTEVQQDVFVGLCIASSAYSFNRAHSASYATVAYQCAFLKHFFPQEWWTSVLSNCKVSDIKEKGYADSVKEILRVPHVNGPTAMFDLGEDNFIHVPLNLIDGVGDAACGAIRAEREKNGPFKSLQDFVERIDGRACNQAVIRQLLLCGAFQYIEPDRSFADMFTEYLYLKKVMKLKIGENKKGDDLKKAVMEYQAKELTKKTKAQTTGGDYKPPVDEPEMYWDDMQVEIAKLRSLPIYRLEVHSHFKHFLGHMFTHDSSGMITYRTTAGPIRVVRNKAELEHHFHTAPGKPTMFVGLIESTEEFQYKDRKTKSTVTALKVHMVNDGEVITVILWPDLYKALGKPNPDLIYLAYGNAKPGREPGSWDMTAEFIRPIEGAAKNGIKQA